jgi:hypothetical protein
MAKREYKIEIDGVADKAVSSLDGMVFAFAEGLKSRIAVAGVEVSVIEKLAKAPRKGKAKKAAAGDDASGSV